LKFEQEGEIVVLDVRGLIYHGDFHFYWNQWYCTVP